MSFEIGQSYPVVQWENVPVLGTAPFAISFQSGHYLVHRNPRVSLARVVLTLDIGFGDVAGFVKRVSDDYLGWPIAIFQPAVGLPGVFLIASVERIGTTGTAEIRFTDVNGADPSAAALARPLLDRIYVVTSPGTQGLGRFPDSFFQAVVPEGMMDGFGPVETGAWFKLEGYEFAGESQVFDLQQGTGAFRFFTSRVIPGETELLTGEVFGFNEPLIRDGHILGGRPWLIFNARKISSKRHQVVFSRSSRAYHS